MNTIARIQGKPRLQPLLGYREASLGENETNWVARIK
jgi:hypothetical protein